MFRVGRVTYGKFRGFFVTKSDSVLTMFTFSRNANQTKTGKCKNLVE